MLVLHGFTGNPSSMRGLATAFVEAGHTVEMPRLPGHGTDVEDMLRTGWSDWSAAAEAALVDLQSRTDEVVVAGLSMGGYGALRLGLLNPKRFAAISAHSSITHMAQMQGFVEESQAEFDLNNIHPLGVIDCAKLNARLPHLRRRKLDRAG